MTTTMPIAAADYIRATNTADSAAFMACFNSAAIVNDAGREFSGAAAIEDWSNREIFAAHVTLEVLGVTCGAGETVVRTKVDGTFDKTGLPDPLLLDHHIVVEGDEITRLTITLVDAASAV